MKQRNYQEEVEKRVAWIESLVKQSQTKGIVLGISGGIDSAVVAVLCQKAVGEKFLGLIMPIESSPVHRHDALLLLKKYKMRYLEVELTKSYNLLADTLEIAYDGTLSSLTKGNMKARMRMIADYAIANQLGYLVAGTDNLSETITGYFTKYGDGAVDFLPISDLTKREVYEMAIYLAIPAEIRVKPPSADLWVGQTDEQEMGVTYEEIEAYLTGELAKESEAYQTISSLYRSSAHKRKLPHAFNQISL